MPAPLGAPLPERYPVGAQQTKNPWIQADGLGVKKYSGVDWSSSEVVVVVKDTQRVEVTAKPSGR